MQTRSRWTAVAAGLGLILVLAWSVVPVAWQVLTSLKPDVMISRLPPVLPETATLEHYRTIFGSATFMRSLVNSAVVAAGTTGLALLIGALCAFAVARLPVPGKTVMLSVALGVSMFPAIAVISPVYLLARALGLRDTLASLILVHTTYTLPLAIWTLGTFFRRVPIELYWAARVDGCSPWRALVSVVLPPAMPGVVVTALLVFIFSWNEFMFALTLTASDRSRTAPVAMALFPSLHEIPWGDLAAASVVVMAPVVLLAIVFQRQFVSGLTAGSVKG